jgi:hypothetical protein
VAKLLSPTSAMVSVTVAADAEPGLREMRIIGSGGASNRVRFAVGQAPETLETEPNSEKAQAQLLASLPVLVNGQSMEGDRDYYRFAARAGQTIVCRAAARQLQPFIADAVPGWNDAVLTLFDSAGRELASVDDVDFAPDPVLVHRVSKDGEYLLEIRDVLLRGRADFVYRLTVSLDAAHGGR